MADFTVLTMEGNHGTLGAPAWVVLGPTAAHELRWSDSSAQKNIASAVWPAMIRPAATAQVLFSYAYTADAVGNGFISNSGAAAAASWVRTDYLWARWNWDNTGTFASAPIWTAYPTVAHGAPTPDDGSLLGGSADTTPVGTAYSYLKGNAYGRVDSAGAPAAGPGADPLVTDGTAGSVGPAAGANWIAAFQSLQGDIDWITFPATPAATTADTWSLEIALFTGPTMTPALYVVVTSLKYTWT